MPLKSLFAALALATASLSWAAGLLEKEVYFWGFGFSGVQTLI